MKLLPILFLLGLSAAGFAAEPQLTAEEIKDTSVTYLTLEDALKIAMSENISVKIADKEIQRMEYARKGTYAALYPQVDGSMSYQRTIKKQVMYMDFDMSSFTGGASQAEGSSEAASASSSSKSSNGGGIEVGRWNNWTTGVTASMPIVSAQLWKSLEISSQEVELAIEKARGSRLGMVTEVKDAFYTVLLAKEVNKVMENAYENAKANLEVTQTRYNAQKVSEMELLRAKTTVANTIPDVYNSRNDIGLALWRLKAVMGVDLESNMDCSGKLEDYAREMFYDIHENDVIDVRRNTNLRQLQIQAEELANTVKLNKMAYVPTLALAFNYSHMAMTNDFNFKEYRWTPYSYIGLSLSIPIFSGGKRLNTLRQSKVQHDEVLLQQTNLERQLKIAVKADLSTMETNMNSYYAAQSAVESARKSYDITSKSYQVGRSTLLDLNSALLALSQAELSQWQAVYGFLTAKSDLEQQLGSDDSIVKE